MLSILRFDVIKQILWKRTLFTPTICKEVSAKFRHHWNGSYFLYQSIYNIFKTTCKYQVNEMYEIDIDKIFHKNIYATNQNRIYINYQVRTSVRINSRTFSCSCKCHKTIAMKYIQWCFSDEIDEWSCKNVGNCVFLKLLIRTFVQFTLNSNEPLSWYLKINIATLKMVLKILKSCTIEK